MGADGFEPPKSKDSRFTVCPIWPLWKTPNFFLSLNNPARRYGTSLEFCPDCFLTFRRASCRIRTNDPEITNHVLWPTELKRRVGSYLHRAATTKYPCYVPILGDSEGAGRTGLPIWADKISASRMQRTCSLLRRSLISQTIFQKSPAKVVLF